VTTSTDCYPSWHADFQPLAEGPQSYISSGCSVGANGNIPCDPEAMRASAEAQFGAPVSLEDYTLARYMQSEVGNYTIEERVAVGEAAVNRAANEGGSILNLLLYRGGSGSGHYGPIHGIGTGTSTAPYGRWAATTSDPTVLTLMLAQLVMSGDSGDFSNGADDQDGPEAWIPQGQAALVSYVRKIARSGKYWVGPLPGVDPWRTFLQNTPGIDPGSDLGAILTQQGIDALTLPRTAPPWTPDMPVCSSKKAAILMSLIGLGLGALAGRWAAKRYLHLM